MSWIPLVSCGLLLLFGCQSDKSVSEREFARLSFRITQLRDAPNEDKAARLTELKLEECEAFCRLLWDCGRAYEGHVLALQQIDQARARQATQTEQALKLLEEAETRLLEARKGTSSCAADQAELERTWGIP